MTNRLFLGDAAYACRALGDARVDLIYIDPPFSVGTTMVTRDEPGQARGRKTTRSGRDAYHDGHDVDALVDMLEVGVGAMRDVMSDRGMLYLHMDYRAVHEAKVMCDRVFGRRGFIGEIAWTPGNGARGARGFSMTHHTLLMYAKGGKKQALFKSDHPILREPYAQTSQQMHFTKTDDDGRRFRERVVNGKSYRYYADEGRRIGSVWTDAPAMVANTPLRAESTGYPTQKPERLLERIIRASSEEGDRVADFMCGSGTTLAVAARLGRTFVGSDSGEVAIETTRARLREAGLVYEFRTLDREPAQLSLAF